MINGVSKSYAMTGWRLGYAAGPKMLIQAMAALISQSTSCVSAVSQAAARVALTADQGCVAEMARLYGERRDRIVALLNAVPGCAARRRKARSMSILRSKVCWEGARRMGACWAATWMWSCICST